MHLYHSEAQLQRFCYYVLHLAELLSHEAFLRLLLQADAVLRH